MSSGCKNWVARHQNDFYVLKAKQDGYRSRASYKLIELNKSLNLFSSNMTVVELGSAPGGWSQVLSNILTGNGKIFAMDILPMDTVAGVEFIQGDFTDDLIYEKLLNLTEGNKIDWVISDMAPNLSGNKSLDQDKSMHLVELSLEFANVVLKKNGNFLSKVFQGVGFDTFIKELKLSYKKVLIKKPKSSRPSSKEVYVLGIEKL